jgi:hypothetical protein
VLPVDADPSFTQKVRGHLRVAERDERVERAARKTGFIQRVEASRLGNRRCVKNHRASCDTSVTGCGDYLLNRFVELLVAHADDNDVRTRHLFRQRTCRSRDAGWTLAVKTNDLHS